MLLQLVAMESPPTHLLLGSDALQRVQAKLVALQDEIARHAS